MRVSAPNSIRIAVKTVERGETTIFDQSRDSIARISEGRRGKRGNWKVSRNGRETRSENQCAHVNDIAPCRSFAIRPGAINRQAIRAIFVGEGFDIQLIGFHASYAQPPRSFLERPCAVTTQS